MFEHLFAKKPQGENREQERKQLNAVLNGVHDQRAEPRSVADASDSATSLPAQFLTHTAARSE